MICLDLASLYNQFSSHCCQLANTDITMGGKIDKKDITKLELEKEEKRKEENEKKEKEPEKSTAPPVPYFRLFRYATTWDKILLFIGVAAAMCSGMSMPLIVIYFSRITENMVSNANSSPGNLAIYCAKYWTPDPGGTSTTPFPTTMGPPIVEDSSAFMDEITKLALIMAYIGIGTCILGFVFVSIFNIVSENQTHRLRILYLEALLRQNVGWYDTATDKNFVSRISEDLMKIGEATGEKVGLCIFFMATCLLSLATAFWYGWKLTLVVLSSAPVIALSASIVAGIQSKVAASEQESYAKAGNVAQEALTNIKTVMAFGGLQKEVDRYEDGLKESKIAGKKSGAVSSFGMGLMWLIVYASYGLAFWYGSKLILEGRKVSCESNFEEVPEYSSDNMLIVFFCVLMGAFNIGQSASYFEAFATGKGAAATIFQIIDRIPEIDSYSDSGKRPQGRAKGKIQFKNVDFCYPSRPDIQILKQFNLDVEPGQTVALVGHSGCGKSTCIQLLQRFYNPLAGLVSLDGENIKDLHIGWLRSQIGVVSQEPILFNTTIAENIRYGRDDVTQKEIEEACRQSNAHYFISKLPNKYETLVGDRGAALSGGQKQRIAIARALVRNPAILLLDEATSALDTQSESIVQAALDNARQGRTTLIVAHRLTTIRNADVVVAINNGQVQEKGTHHELIKEKGLYHALVLAQLQGRGEALQDVEEEIGELEACKGLNKGNTESGSAGFIEDETITPVVLSGEDSLSEKELAKQAPVSRLLKLNISEWPLILIGTISAAFQGSVMPVYAIIFGEVLQTLSEPDEEEAQRKANMWSLAFVGVGLLAGISMFLQLFMFSLAGEALTQRLRKLSFAAMLRQELGWFDEPLNNIGSLLARLSGDAASVQGATGSIVGTIVQSLSTIIIAISLAMYYKPKLGAVALAFVPFVILATYFEGLMLFGQNISEKRAVEESSKIAVQAVSNIRTVASLCKERSFVKMYMELLAKCHKQSMKINLLRGFIFGFSQSVPFLAYAAVYYYGGWLVQNEEMPYGIVFKVGEALIFGTTMIGKSLAFTPNFNKAKISGARILALLDRRPKIENSPGVGLQIRSSTGSVKYEQIAFHYPTRPNAKILKSLSMEVQPGTSVALVGPSGCGKSTTVQLILRFYDPMTGKVRLDNQDVAALQVDSLRSQMAIVAQEPALFDRTIAQNIAYGDNSRIVTMDEIINAAKMANIHSFISALPTGYETRVGEMGTQLSGGQKQRVAIARALVRNPKILLLDEATSALDTESEAVVQAALDEASSGRTSITIAHRLSSIQNVDKIIVINHGEVHESGTHDELLQKQGLYHQLWNMQGSNNRT